jgi:hypothetical protein
MCPVSAPRTRDASVSATTSPRAPSSPPPPLSRSPRTSASGARRSRRSSEPGCAHGGEAAAGLPPRARSGLSSTAVAAVRDQAAGAVHALVADRFRRHLVSQVVLNHVVRPAAARARLGAVTRAAQQKPPRVFARRASLAPRAGATHT